VVVAAGAGHGQPEHAAGDDVDLFVDVVHVEPRLEPLIDILDPQRQVTGRGQQPIALGIR